MSLGRAALTIGIVFALALAVVVIVEMSTEALAVVIGVVCGIAAGLPASILLFVTLSRRNDVRAGDEAASSPGEGYPPVVVIQGGTPPGPVKPGDYWPVPPPQALRPPIHLVGGEDLLLEDGQEDRD
jgi:hypothetical protein